MSWPFNSPREHYAALYDVSPRTISRWSGKNLPLDDEAEMRALLASGLRGVAISAPIVSGTPVIAPSGGFSEQKGALGLAASIKRLQEAERAAGLEYEAASKAGDAAKAATAQRTWLAFSEQLRKVEQSTPEVEEANNQAIKLGTLQEELGSLFAELRQDLESMAGRVSLELIGKDEISIAEIIRRETNRIIEALYLCKYLGGHE